MLCINNLLLVISFNDLLLVFCKLDCAVVLQCLRGYPKGREEGFKRGNSTDVLEMQNSERIHLNKDPNMHRSKLIIELLREPLFSLWFHSFLFTV